MIGCLILGTFAAVGAARLVRYRMGWAGCHGGGGWHGHVHSHWRRHFHGRSMGGWGYGRSDAEGDGGGDADPGAGEFGAGRFSAPWGGGGWGRHAEGGSHRGQDFVLGAVLDHLRTTPTQERTIRAAAGEFREEVKRVAGGEGKKTRLDVAAAIRKPVLDELLLGDLFARQDTALEGTRKAFVGLMAKVHDALDEEQRGRLGELLEKGPRFWRRGFDW
jgi:hypothetical protein